MTVTNFVEIRLFAFVKKSVKVKVLRCSKKVCLYHITFRKIHQ